jgi:hypothetical protein
LYLDLDDFKTVNDAMGHHVGDEILARVAGVLRSVTREIDLTGRFGGDEFLILLPEASAQQAGTVAARILKEIGAMNVVIAGDVVAVTASIQEVKGLLLHLRCGPRHRHRVGGATQVGDIDPECARGRGIHLDRSTCPKAEQPRNAIRAFDQNAGRRWRTNPAGGVLACRGAHWSDSRD